MRAKHILCPSKHTAEDVLRKLNEKKYTFEELAQKFSECPSRENGGDLGDLSRKKHLLAEDFLEALEKLKVGETSTVVRSPFGYHLIKRY